MKKKVVATIISVIEIDTDWYLNKDNDYIAEVEKENLIEWFMENIILTKVEVK